MATGDVIAAIATPSGRGGIGVVRVSGAGLKPMATALSGKSEQQLQPRRALLSNFLAADGEALDRGLLLYFPGPDSFTGEDVLELHGHGGAVVMQTLLQRCCELGARLAQPGEFARRAFDNDKIDLAQAEAIADLIDAASGQAARSALRSLNGEFSTAVHTIVDQLTELRILIESLLDFPEEEHDALSLLTDLDVTARLESLYAEFVRLQQRAQQGAILRSGLHVVLAGAPNVGKSSLLNRLAGEERAIVTDIAGTTRDPLNEIIHLDGIPLHVIDTAGLRDSDDPVEKLGVERAWKELQRADVVVQIMDARLGVTTADEAIDEKMPPGAERIIVSNKCDLVDGATGRSEDNGRICLRLSAKTGAGMHLLHDELLRIAGWGNHGEDVILARQRHLDALETAAGHMEAAARIIDRLEFAAEELRLAQDALASITGAYSADDLLGDIFSRFCIGK